MAAPAKFTLEQIIVAARTVWIETGAMPSVNAVRQRLSGGDADRIEFGISLVGVESGVNCAVLDAQPAEVRVLVTDPRGPNGVLPLDALTSAQIPEGVLAGAITLVKAVAQTRAADQRELERRVGLERDRADTIARACEMRIAAALAAQLSAEQRYAHQDAEHERNTRALRDQLAASLERVRVLEQSAPEEFVMLTNAITRTGDAVNGVSDRLANVERLVRPTASATRAAPGKARQRTRTPKSAPRGGAKKAHPSPQGKGREAPAKPIVRRSKPVDAASADSAS